MLSLPGYSICEQIRASSRGRVYRGVRSADGHQVVIKAYPMADAQAPNRVNRANRAEREFQALRRIDSDGVARPIELLDAGALRVLVLEQFPGLLLSHYMQTECVSLDEVLGIAIGLGRSLAAVHDARIIHKDVKPGNVLLAPQSMRVCLIDFGIAAEYGRAETSLPPEIAEGTVYYIAPEQTGRLGVGIDFRTDLYSLGATLYELLSGHPPFGRRSGRDLVYSHLAIRPEPLTARVPGLPRAVSRLVDKLLEKDPELRYQTARGLLADLELCRKQLLEEGEIDPELRLGREDASDRLRFPSKLYGRDGEIRELCAALDRVTTSGVEWLLLNGPGGIGKSSLVNVLREPLVRAGGFLAAAKFDPDRSERPYAGFATALEGLVSQMLAGGPAGIAEWSQRLRSQIGSLLGVLTELVPSLGDLIDQLPSVPRVGFVEQRERLALAVCRFVGAIASPERPLVLLFDDLQWADSGSLGLLTALVRSGGGQGMLVIGGYRDDEVGPAHPLSRLLDEVEKRGIPLTRLELRPLGLEHTTAMLAEALGRTPEETEGLARQIGLRSQHNPLLTRRLAFHLWDRDLIRYAHGEGWVWDEEGLSEADITDDAAEMLASRIDSLQQAEQSLVKIASLLGTEFDADMLVELSRRDPVRVMQQLLGLVDQGLVAPCARGFRFVHDRIREAAQSRLTPRERAGIHAEAARVLVERTLPASQPRVVFELADHMLGSLALPAEERPAACAHPQLLETLHRAGERGLATGAASTAAYYLERAHALLTPEDWDDRFGCAFGIEFDAAEAAMQMRRFELAAERLGSLEGRPLPDLFRARVAAKRIALCGLTGSEDAVDVGLARLREFGVKFSKDRSYLRTFVDMWLTDRAISRRTREGLFGEQPISDPAELSPMILLAACGARMAMYSNRLSSAATCFALRFHRSHAQFSSPAFTLASFANLWITIARDVPRAMHYASAAEYWMERIPNPALDARCRVLLYSLVYPYSRPRRTCLEVMGQAAELSLELGDLEYAGIARQHQLSVSILIGEPIDRNQHRLTSLDSGETNLASHNAAVVAIALRLLRGPAPQDLDWPGPLRELDDLLEAGGLRAVSPFVLTTGILCILGRFADAASLCERLLSRVKRSGGLGGSMPDFLLYRGVAMAAERSREHSRARLNPIALARSERALGSSLRQLRRFARTGPDFVHMVVLLEAEVLRTRGRIGDALRRYESAARDARRLGYVQHAGFAHERRAELLQAAHRETELSAALAEARERYKEWGATSKVAQLDRWIESISGG